MSSDYNNCFFAVTQHKYQMTLEAIKKIEDCPDEFMTQQEVIDLVGEHVGHYNQTITNHNLVQQDLNVLVEQATKAGKKSFTIDDEELYTAVCCGYNIKHYLPYAYRRANKIYLKNKDDIEAAEHKKKEKAHRIEILEQLLYSIEQILSSKLKGQCNIEVHYKGHDREGAIRLLKPLVNYDDVLERILANCDDDSCKQLYGDNYSAKFKEIWDSVDAQAE